jgi:GNAT superfamily N-acetyltransferase
VPTVPIRFVELPTSHPDSRRLLAAFYAEIRGRLGFDLSRQANDGDMDPPGGRFLVGYEGAAPVACGGIRTWDTDACEVKRMFVRPEARRHGAGRELLEAIERAAHAAGFRRVLLDTLASHVEAVALYDSSGYARVPPYNENPYAGAWFSKEL